MSAGHAGRNSVKEPKISPEKHVSKLDCTDAISLTPASYIKIQPSIVDHIYPVPLCSTQPTTESHVSDSAFCPAVDGCNTLQCINGSDSALITAPLHTSIQPLFDSLTHMNQLMAASCSSLPLSCSPLPDQNGINTTLASKQSSDACGPHTPHALYPPGGIPQLAPLCPSSVEVSPSDLPTLTHLSVPFAVPSGLELIGVPGEAITAQSVVASELNSSQTTVTSTPSRMVVRGTQSEYYVMVHVDAGATFSVRVGDQIQHIPGPATVRMVSNSGPPIPMPMQVPAGHLVQQIVDEEGILKHVILSLYPGPAPPPLDTPLAPVHSHHANGIVQPGTGVQIPALHFHPAALPHQPHPPFHHHHHHHVPVPQHQTSAISNHLRLSGPVSLGLFTDLGSPPSTVSQFYASPAQPTSIAHSQISTAFPTPFHSTHFPHPQQLASLTTNLKRVANAFQSNGSELTNHSEYPVLVDPTVAVATSCQTTSQMRSIREMLHPCLSEEPVLVSADVMPTSTSAPANTTQYSSSVSPDELGTRATSSDNCSNKISERSDVTDHILPDGLPSNMNHLMKLSSSVAHSPKPTTQQWSEIPNIVKDHLLPPSSSCEIPVYPLERIVATETSSHDAPSTPLNDEDAAGALQYSVSSGCGRLPISHVITGLVDTSGPTFSAAGANSYRRRNRANSGKGYVAPRATQRQNACCSTTKPQSFIAAHLTLPNDSATSTSCPSSTALEPLSSNCSSPDHGSTAVCNRQSSSGLVQMSTQLTSLQPSSFNHNYPHHSMHSMHTNFLLSNPTAPPETNQDIPSIVNSECDVPIDCCPHTRLDTTGISNGISLSAQPTAFSTTASITNSPHAHLKPDLEYEAIQSLLSAIGPPEVSGVKAFSALIHLVLPSDLTVTINRPPLCSRAKQGCIGSTSSDMAETSHKLSTIGLANGFCVSGPQTGPSTTWTLNERDIQFELHLAERDCAAPFSCIFIGEAMDISLQDLRAASDYYIKYRCVFSDIRGRFSEVVHFATNSTVPSAPRNVMVLGHTRTTIQLKWSAASDHGSRITAYCVEYAPASTRHHNHITASTNWVSKEDEAFSGAVTERTPRFVSGFQGLAKTCNLIQLTPSTDYFIRVMARNAHGQGPWSSVVTASTAGSPPQKPPTPFLLAVDVHALTLAWHQPEQLKQSPTGSPVPETELNYTLEMDDETMGHGFVTVFDGSGTENRVENLRRNTRYRFRLSASNIDGRSPWTDIVTFSTLPDRPSAPRNLKLVGSVQSASLTLSWDAPEDDGGLPICAYRLEARLPCSSPLDLTDGTHASRFDIEEPAIVGLADKTHFAYDPPSASGTLSAETSGFRTTASFPKVVCSGSSPESTHSDDFSPPLTSMLERSPDSIEPRVSPDACFEELRVNTTQLSSFSGAYRFAWFIVYEGASRTFTLERLLPGIRLSFRVRARSTTVPDLHSGYPEKETLWGPSSSLLELSLPPIPPTVPASPRIVGHPKPTSLHLTWKSPKHTGGSSITAYEVWQISLGCSYLASEDSDPELLPLLRFPSSPLTSSSGSDVDLYNPHLPLRPFSSTVALKRCSSLESGISRLPESHHYQIPSNLRYSRPYSRNGHLVCVVSDAECVINNLRPGWKYGFRVRACNLVGWGPWSQWAILSTVASPPGAPPRPPRLLADSSGIVTVFWDPVTRTNGSKIKEYWLEWQPLPAELLYHTRTSTSQIRSRDSNSSASPLHSKTDDFQLVYTGPALSFELLGAQPASRLAFRFCAVNEAGPGPWSPVGICVIPSAPPGQPYGLRVSDCQPDAARVHWFIPQPNGSPITTYTIELSKCPKDKESTGTVGPAPSVQTFDIPAPVPITLDTSGSSRGNLECKQSEPVVDYLFTDLDSDVSYNVRIRAQNAMGHGPFSSIFTFNTPVPAPNPPLFGTPTHLNANSVRLQWQPANDLLATSDSLRRHGARTRAASLNLSFTLQMQREPDCEWCTVYEGPDTGYKVTRLVENTTYSFRLRAENLTGPSDFSETLLIKTPRFPPPAVRGLKLIDVQIDSCHLEWTPVTHPWTDPVVYVVHLFPSAQYSALQSASANIPNQIYRGSQNSCRLSGLAPNTEFLVRVCAVRMCLPTDLPVTRTLSPTLLQNIPPFECNFQASEWSREQFDESSYQITELSGPFSHFLAFSTKPSKSPKLVDDTSAQTTRTGLKARWRFISSIRLPLLSYFTVTSSAPVGDPAAATCNPLVHSSRRKPATNSTPSMGVIQAPFQISAQSTIHRQPQVGTFHFKRNQHLSRLSDRKLALLLLLLFGAATVLVSVSLQQFLTALPTPVSSGFDVHPHDTSPEISDAF